MKKLGVVCTAVVSLLGSAGAVNANPEFNYDGDGTEIAEITTYDCKDGKCEKTTSKVKKNATETEVVATKASAKDKYFYDEDKFAAEDVDGWLDIKYAQRDEDNPDTIKLKYEGKEATGNEHLIATKNSDITIQKAIEDTKNSEKGANSGKFFNTLVSGYQATFDNVAKDDKDGQDIRGAVLYIEKDDFYDKDSNPEGVLKTKQISNVIFKDNSTILKVDDEVSDKSEFENRKVNVRGGAIGINAKDILIEKIEGDFIRNKVKVDGKAEAFLNADGGAIFITEGTIGGLSEDGSVNTAQGIVNSLFEGNVAKRGGAIYNNKTTINNISAIFIENKAGYDDDDGWSASLANGGAIYNETNSDPSKKIGAITNSQFIKNSAKNKKGGSAYGGAVFNNGIIGDITDSVFVENEVDGDTLSEGGAIFNRIKDKDVGTIGNIDAVFVGNKAHQGGAISNQGKIGTVDGYFAENIGDGTNLDSDIFGGAIFNGGDADTKMGKITADFYKNKVTSKGNNQGAGGAIANKTGTIDGVEGWFVENEASTAGGAIYNESEIGTVTGEFVGNKAAGGNNVAGGGAIYNAGTLSESGLSSNFYNNETTGNGGAIYNEANAKIGKIKGLFTGNKAENGGAIHNASDMHIEDSVFADNTAATAGGAIQNEVGGNLTFSGTNWFINNKAGDTLNDINNDGSMTISKNGAVILDGSITGNGELTVESAGLLQTNNSATINNKVDNSGRIDVADGKKLSFGNDLTLNNGSALVLGHMANVNIAGDLIGSMTNALDGADNNDANEAQIRFNVWLDESGNPTTNVITVDGQVKGKTHVIADASSTNEAEHDRTWFQFLEAKNDIDGTDEGFSVSRVISSPYMWEAARNIKDETEGSNWYLKIQGTDNPGADIVEPEPDEGEKPTEQEKPEQPVYTPEVGGFAALHQIALEQNRSIANGVLRGIEFEKSPHCYRERCGIVEVNPKKRAWIYTGYENADVKSPAEFDADIRGVTMGVDFYRDYWTRSGIFGAYRQGEYDLNGKGKYLSTISSKLKDKSYLGGLYYKYDNYNWGFFGTVYGGKQSMDMRTNDHVVTADTHATQYGANAEITKHIMLSRHTSLSPFAGLSYTMIDIDDMFDNVGKSAKLDVLHYLSAELGAKLEYIFCDHGNTNRLYIKPSVIRTFSEGGKTRITGIQGPIRTFKDRTLGRGEIGGEWGLTRNWSATLNAGYTFGDDYSAYDINAGIAYQF